MKRSNLITLGLIILLLVGFITKRTMDNREKNLADLLRAEKINYEDLDMDFERIDDQEAIDQLLKFLAKYDVKRMKNRDWDSNVSGLKGFSLHLYGGDEIVIMSLFEDRIHFNSSFGPRIPYYHVTNGPVDMEWLEEFYGEFVD